MSSNDTKPDDNVALKESKFTLIENDNDESDKAMEIAGDLTEEEANTALSIADGGEAANQRRVIVVPWGLIAHVKTTHFVATICYLLLTLGGFVAAGTLPHNRYLQAYVTSAFYDKEDPTAMIPEPRFVGTVHILWLLPAMNLMLAISRFFQWHCLSYVAIEKGLRDGTNLFQWIEYSFVCPLQMLTLGLVVGIRELQTLLLLAGLAMAWALLMCSVELLDFKPHKHLLFWYGFSVYLPAWAIISVVHHTRVPPPDNDFITVSLIFVLLMFYVPTTACVFLQQIGCGGCVHRKPYRDATAIDSSDGIHINDLERRWCARNSYFIWLHFCWMAGTQLSLIIFLSMGASRQ